MLPVKIITNGLNNEVEALDGALDAGRGTIIINGDNTWVKFGRGCVINNCDISLSQNSCVEVGNDCYFNSIFVYGSHSTKFIIGSRVSFNARVRLLAHEPSQIELGNDCLFASDVDVMTSDMHSIFDEQTRRRINPARSIRIGNRVWLGDRVSVLKGSSIGDGSVVGSGSIVSGELPGKSVSAGSPARVIRTGVVWDERLLDDLPKIAHDNFE